MTVHVNAVGQTSTYSTIQIWHWYQISDRNIRNKFSEVFHRFLAIASSTVVELKCRSKAWNWFCLMCCFNSLSTNELTKCLNQKLKLMSSSLLICCTTNKRLKLTKHCLAVVPCSWFETEFKLGLVVTEELKVGPFSCCFTSWLKN